MLVFNIYVVYEQTQLNRIRRAFTDNLYKMAVRDPVTNMFNRWYIMHRLEEEIGFDANGTAAHLSVIAFDLDCFKQINDEYGHAGWRLRFEKYLGNN